MGTRHNYAKQTSSENKISCLLEKGSSEQWDCFEEKIFREICFDISNLLAMSSKRAVQFKLACYPV